MKEIGRRIEDTFIEIAFAEERDIRYVHIIRDRFTERLDAFFTAITFAEAGEFDAARCFMGGGTGNSKRNVERQMPRFCAGRA